MNKALNNQVIEKERLASLDILRGFDLFLLVFFQPVFVAIAKHWSDVPFFAFMLRQFNHVDWEGFAAWDLVMPLFLFMVGASMPFSFSKYRSQSKKGAIYKRIIRRFIILFILGMVIQGNLLSLNPIEFRIYTNTLQAISVGYLIASIFLLHLSNRNQFIATGLLLFVYWALLSFLGDFSPEGNFAEKVDRLVLARFRDGVYYNEAGNWHFSPHYHYTWVLSSLVFAVTTMLGVFAGKIMKDSKDKKKNTFQLLIWGVALLTSGWLLSFQTPIIKKIWSASMTLFSGGLSFLLMALFYYVIDYKKKSKGLHWLKFYGMNAITAYTIGMVVNFRSVARSLLWGFERYIGDYYHALIEFANYSILFLILYAMYRAKLFIKI